MTARKGIVLALQRCGERAQSTELPVLRETVAAAGENLVAVSLMAHIPHEAVFGSIENIMTGHRYLHCPETRRKVTRIDTQLVDNESTQFGAHLRQLIDSQFSQIGGRINFINKAKFFLVCH